MNVQNSEILRKIMFYSCIIAFLAVYSTVVYAQQSEQVYETISKSQIMSIMQGEGYAVSYDEREEILWKLEGNPTYIYFIDDDQSIMFWAGVESDNTTLRNVNDWNMNARYSRAYIDEEGDPILELDLDLEGGVTRDRIVDFLITCRDSYNLWLDECIQ
ncbi:YbjN domain-containing protein [Candidatus Latescibacterota bacterium]